MPDFVGDPTPGSTPAAPVQTVGSPAPEPVAAPSAGAPPLPGGQPASAPAAVADTTLPQAGSNKELRDHFERVIAGIRAENTQLTSRLTGYESVQKKIAEAFGSPKDPAEQTKAQREEIRKELETLYPELGRLREMEAATERLNVQLGLDTMEKVFATYATRMGGAPNDKAQRQIHRAFVSFLESDPNLGYRYERRDPKLITEFFEDLDAGLFQASRVARGAAASTRAVPVAPRGGTSSSPVTGQAPKKFKDIDEMLDAATGSLASQ